MLFNSIRKLKGKERGRRAFVLANGPSVKYHDLSKCGNDVLIGMNASTVLQDKHEIEIDYYCVSDRRFLLHSEKVKFATDYLKEKTVCVYREELKDLTEKDKTFFCRSLGRDGFSHDLSHGFYFGCSTTIMCIQLASYLGCNEIYLLGVDLQYKNESPRFYSEGSIQIEDSFLSVQLMNFITARKALEKKGVKLSICSANSLARPYVPFVDFESL